MTRVRSEYAITGVVGRAWVARHTPMPASTSATNSATGQ
jgi:hypothetical protein